MDEANKLLANSFNKILKGYFWSPYIVSAIFRLLPIGKYNRKNKNNIKIIFDKWMS